MQELDQLHNRLNRLLKRFQELKAEKEKLLKKIERQEQALKEQSARMEVMEQELQSRTIAGHIGTDGDDKAILKQYLDELIQQVEYNIKLLKH